MINKVKKTLGNLPQNSVWIDNKWMKAENCESYEVINPATGEVLLKCARSDSEIVNLAVMSAKRAYENKSWRYMSPSDRGRLLGKIARLISERQEELAYIEALNNGKTINDAENVDLPETINTFEYFAGWAGKNLGDVIPVDGPFLNYTIKQPVGVVGLIIPWNYPLIMAAWKLAPALVTGNTIVLKPSELTPITAMILMEILKEAGVPDGVVNMVTGFGETGELITRHKQVNKVAFTGSRATATRIVTAAAESNLKRVSLELGGKSPNIVFADADIDKLIDQVFWGIFFNKGEVCAAGSRLIIHKDIHDEVVERLAMRAKAMRVGNPLDRSSEMGSLISRKQMDKVLGYIEKGLAEGARLVTGGKRLTGNNLEKGFFVEPTIFDNVTKDMTIAKEEIFGPVLSVIAFDTEEEAVDIANSTIYGLVSAIWTKDVSRAMAIAEKIDSGIVWINHFSGFDPASPFGGFKESGWGREKGANVLDLYTETKSVWVPIERR